MNINGIPLNQILDSVTLLQKAGIDTSSVSMHLCELIAKTEEEEKAQPCQHNWVLDGHNCGEGICSKCFARE